MKNLSENKDTVSYPIRHDSVSSKTQPNIVSTLTKLFESFGEIYKADFNPLNKETK